MCARKAIEWVMGHHALGVSLFAVGGHGTAALHYYFEQGKLVHHLVSGINTKTRLLLLIGTDKNAIGDRAQIVALQRAT
jgi:hypothetical protein